MPPKHPATWHVVSVRLPHDLLQRFDRYLDWRARSREGPSSRNAAVRAALETWLADQEQRAGFFEPHTSRTQLQHAYRSLSAGHDWVAIHQLRHLLPWSRERFDAVLEALRADHLVELDRGELEDMGQDALRDSYHVYGQCYSRLRWRP